VSFCGEDAGRPLEALVLSAIGFRSLSMRPASVGPVKHLLRQVDIVAAGKAVSAALDAGEQDIREMINAWLVEHHQASRSVT
jgi:phosphotransferase system enzyme I (PtsP)